MNSIATHPPTSLRIAQAALWLNGIAYIITALLLLFAPAWFFQYIGDFPPYNRHYEGDVGAFLLPIGLGLIIAARNPTRHRLFIAVVALGSIIHILNHLYDDLGPGQSFLHLVTDLSPLVLFAIILLPALRNPAHLGNNLYLFFKQIRQVT